MHATNSRLERQRSTISCNFEPRSARYFCCFGLFHAKMLGFFVAIMELFTQIGTSAYLFIQSAKYSTAQWRSAEVLVEVEICLFVFFVVGIGTVCLFSGVCYEKSRLVLPYVIIQGLYILFIYVVLVFLPQWICHGLIFSLFHWFFLLSTLGTYRYLTDFEKARDKLYNIEQFSLHTLSCALPSTVVSKKSVSLEGPTKLLHGSQRAVSIDHC